GQLFVLSCRLSMNLRDEIAARHEAPRGPGRDALPRLSRCPPEELALGVARVRHHSTGVTRFRIALVEEPRRTRAIDAERRMMHHARVIGTEFERAHITWPRQRDRHDEGS